jgi:hypothetical protein
LHYLSKHEVQELAAHSNEAKKLTRLCQKPPSSRTEQEVSYIQAQVSALVPFFRLWPEALQHELARMLQTEVGTLRLVPQAQVAPALLRK